MTKRKLTAYQRERQNLLKRVRRLEKQGFQFLDLQIPRTAKAAKSLRGLSLVAKSSGFINQKTGEYTEPTEMYKALKAESHRKSAQTRKHKRKKLNGPVVEEASLVMDVVYDFIEQSWVYIPQGKRKRNYRWERVNEAKRQGKELVERILAEELAQLTASGLTTIQANMALGRRVVQSGLDSATLRAGLFSDSNPIIVQTTVNKLAAALRNRPLTVEESKALEALNTVDYSEPK